MSEVLENPAEGHLEVTLEQSTAIMRLAADVQRIQMAPQGDPGDQQTVGYLEKYHKQYLSPETHDAAETEVVDTVFMSIGLGVVQDKERFELAATVFRQGKLSDEQSNRIIEIAANAHERRRQGGADTEVGATLAREVRAEYDRVSTEGQPGIDTERYMLALIGVGVGGTVRQPQFGFQSGLHGELLKLRQATNARQAEAQ